MMEPPTSIDQEDPQEVERRSKIHTVIEKLKQQIPTLLTTPLSEVSSKAVYEDDVKLLVSSSTRNKEEKDIVLASSREEIVSLSTTLALAVTATNQANSFFVRPTASSETSASAATFISKMAIDPSARAIHVQWRANLLPGNNADSDNSNMRTLQGVSELEFDSDSGKVKTLRLLQVKWNGEAFNARAIGESLASLRQLVVAFQESPVLKSFLPKSMVPSISSILKEVASMQQQQFGQSKDKPQSTPLFVVDSLETVANTYKSSTNANNTNATKGGPSNATMNYIPIDEYDAISFSSSNTSTDKQSSLPLPGSNIWSQYVLSRQVMEQFVSSVLPVLSGTQPVPSKDIVDLFDTRVSLKATDGTELLRGRDQVYTFYHTLSSWRKRSSGTWNMTNASLLSWGQDDNSNDEVKIAIDFIASSSMPGASSPVIIKGTDVFVLEKPAIDRFEESGEEEFDILIRRIEESKLEIEGAGLSSADGLWFMKSLVAALDTARFSSVGGDSVVMDLIQKMITGDITLNGKSVSTSATQIANGDSQSFATKKKKKRRAPPKLSESAASRVYNIMADLHNMPAMFEDDNLRNYQLPAAHEFMAETVELRGYLGETLARGSQSYNTAIGTAIASLKGALVTGSVKMQEMPSVRVELTKEGHVRLALALDLKVLPLPTGASNLISSMSGSTISIPSGGFPLKIVLVSDYVIEKQTGQIFQHRLLETRINGQLTPGDVISRWIQKQVDNDATSGGNANGRPDNGVAFQRGLLEAVSWLRSMSGRRN